MLSSQEILNAEHVSTIEVAEDTIEGGCTSKNPTEPRYVNTEEIREMRKSGGATIFMVGDPPPKPKAPPKPAPRLRNKNDNTTTPPHPQTSFQAQTKQTPDSSPGNTIERSVTSDYGSDSRSASSSPAKFLEESKEPHYVNAQIFNETNTLSKKKAKAPPPPVNTVEGEHLKTEKSKVHQILPNSQSVSSLLTFLLIFYRYDYSGNWFFFNSHIFLFVFNSILISF